MDRAFEDRLGFEFITALGLEPARFVALAAKLGIRRVGLAPAPIAGPYGSDPAWTLRDDPQRLRALKQALADHGVEVSLGEGFLIMPGADIAAAEADIDLMAEIGVRRLNINAMDPDPARNGDQFATFAALAAARGLPVTVEFIAMTPVGDLAAGIALVEQSGADNAGVLVDAMHLFASGGTAQDLRGATPGLVTYAQLCDARKPGFFDGYFDDARYERPLPGEGVLPLADFIAALPTDCTIGIETPMSARAQAGMGHEDRLERCLAATRALHDGKGSAELPEYTLLTHGRGETNDEDDPCPARW